MQASKHDEQLEIDGEMIRYKSSVYSSWEIPLSQVRLIGEATNQDGPFADDYFFCFPTDSMEWYEASFYASNRDIFLKKLNDKLRANIELSLVGSTDFASNILWPARFAGQPMFEFHDAPSKNILKRLLRINHKVQKFSRYALEILKDNAV